MSTVRETLLAQALAACKQCFSKQLELIAEAHRLPSDTKDRNADLYLEVLRMGKLEPFPDVPEETVSQINTINEQVPAADSSDELDEFQNQLLAHFQSIGEAEDEKTATSGTDNLLNKRMIDQLHLMKDKIRNTRRRLNDAGGGYDEEAYKAARNQIYLTQHVYLEQLDNDLVFATNEGCARLEQVVYPAILAAGVDNFIATLLALQNFLQERVLAAEIV